MLNLTFRAQSRVAGAAISEREQMAVGARHSWTKLQFVCTSEQADSAVIGSAKGRDERPLTGDHLGNVTGDFWPISDRFASPNRPFSAANPGPAAFGKYRPIAVSGERRLRGSLISSARVQDRK